MRAWQTGCGILGGMPMRATELAGTTLVALAAPVVVAFVIKPAAEPAKPPGSKLDVALTSPALLGDGDAVFMLDLLAPGPLTPAEFADPAGGNRATVSSGDTCSGARSVSTGLPNSTQHVCVRITGLRAGSAAAGSLAFGADGRSGKVAVTLSARHRFFGVPLLAVLLGILGSGALIAGRRVLQAANDEAAIDRTAKKERSAADTVTGLSEWSKAARSAGMPAASRFGIVAKIAGNGPAHTRDLRGTLCTLLDTVGERVGARNAGIVAAADAEAARTDHVVGDFVDAEGKDVVHPAQRYAEDLRTPDEVLFRLAYLEALATGLTDKPTPTNRLRFAIHRFSQATSPVDRADLVATVTAAEEAFLTADVDLYAAFAEPGAAEPAAPAVLADLLAAEPDTLRLVNVLAVAVIVAAAVVSVMFTSWMPSTTFGTSTDYFKLLAAAVASGAGAGLVAAISSWYRPAGKEA